MKKLLLILITAVVGLVAHADKIIYYDNSNTGWTTCKITYWKTGDNGWSYNKKDMTAVSGATNIWKFSVPDDTSGILFTNGDDNGENQTEDCYDVQGGHLYKGTKNGSSSKCSVQRIGVYNGGSQGGDTYTIYFYADNENDMEVYCHIFGASDITTWGQLPKMTDTKKYVKIGDNDYRKAYSYTFTTTVTPTNVIFNSAKGDATKYTGTCDFSNGMFYHKVANAGVCEPETQTLVDKGSVDPVPTTGQYTIYFYDKKDLGSVMVHIWGTNTLHPDKDSQEAMTPMNKYVQVGSNYYPVYKYTFDWDKVPSGLMFYKTGDGDKQTGDCRFINNAFYTNDNNVGVTGLKIVDRRDDVVTVYMHWKEDFNKKGDGDAPWCIPFKGPWGDTNYLNKDHADAKKMYLVDKKYQIWGCDINKNDLSKYDNIGFFFYGKDENRVDYYIAGNAEGYDGGNNWYKYIFTVNDGRKAPQAYLTYADFTAEVAKGYQNLYVTGGVTSESKYDGMTMKVDDGSSDMKALSWEPANALKVSPDTKGDPVFFLQLHPYLNNKNITAFKLSWIDTKTYKAKHTSTHQNSMRDWATYDLGIIGVDDETNNPSWGISTNTDAKQCYFKYNKANPLLEYNQFDWTITESNMSGSGVSEYYCVVDMHPDCRTVTLCSFNPQPSVSVTPGEVHTGTLTSQQAIDFHDELNALRGSDVNGHVMFEKVNYLSGSVKVTGAPGVTSGVVTNANFKREYTISLDGTKLFSVDHPATYNVDFLPLDESSEMTIANKYTSTVTNLSFHSRTRKADVNVPAAFQTPVVEAVDNAEYVYSETTGKMRAYAKLNVTHSNTNNHHVYTDFEIKDNGGSKVYKSPVAHKDDEYFKEQSSMPSMMWTPCSAPEQWNSTDHDWSSKCVESFNNSSVVIPFFINDALLASDFPDFKKGDKLPQKTFDVSLDVVYPILYSSKPTVTETASVNPTAMTLAQTGSEIPDDLSDFGLSFYRTTGTATVQTKANVTGVDDVFGDAEADNADAPAEYYTISGVRVNGDLAPGIYVVRRGNKVTKEVVK